MKRTLFIPIFIAAHVVFVFLQIHQYSKIIKISYEKQKNEQHVENLLKKQQSLTHTFNALQNKSAIKQFAQQQLHMQPVSLKQIKKLHVT